MRSGTSISEFFNREKSIFSLEFFPPKNKAGGERMLKTASILQPYNPDFVSITYGAGGGTRQTTMQYARILKNGTAYQTDAGMCGDYDSVIGMNKENSINRFLKENSKKHFPAIGEATLSGVIVDCDIKTGLANKIDSYIFGGQLSKT